MKTENKQQIDSNKKKNQNAFLNWLKKPAGLLPLFAVALVLLNLVAGRAFFRWDITGPKSYSLSPVSREVVKTIQEPLDVKVFFTNNLPAPYSTVRQYVEDILSEYSMAANSNFRYEYLDMDKEENQRMASSYGLQQLQIREIKNNEMGFKNAFMGMVITYADQMELLDNLTSTDGMEFKITTTISRVIANTNLLSSLSNGVQVTLYKSQELAALRIDGFSQLDSIVQDVVETLNKKYEGRLSYSVVSPSIDDVSALHAKYGVPYFEDKEKGVIYGTMALVLENGDVSRCIPFQIGKTLDLVNGVVSFVVQGTEYLGDYMDETLKSLASNVTTVAYITGHGELDVNDSEAGSAALASLIQDSYTLKEVKLAEEDIPVGIQSVIINAPRTEFTEAELYKLDQFLMNGGNLVVFQDPFEIQNPQTQYEMPQYRPVETGLEALLEKYGIALKHEYVMDKNCAVTQDQWSGREVELYYAPVVDMTYVNQKHPVSKNLGQIVTFLSGSVDASAAREKGLTVSDLVVTSNKSWVETDSFILDPNYLAPPSEDKFKSSPVVTIVEGSFSSAYTEAPVKGDDDTAFANAAHLSKSARQGKICVVATSAITSNYLTQSFFSKTALLLQNIIDYMNGNEDLCTMRTKGLSLNTLKTTTGTFVNVVKYFNEIGLALLVVIAGLIVLLVRRHRRNAIRMRYNPDDGREISKTNDAKKKEGSDE